MLRFYKKVIVNKWLWNSHTFVIYRHFILASKCKNAIVKIQKLSGNLPGIEDSYSCPEDDGCETSSPNPLTFIDVRIRFGATVSYCIPTGFLCKGKPAVSTRSTWKFERSNAVTPWKEEKIAEDWTQSCERRLFSQDDFVSFVHIRTYRGSRKVQR